MNLLQVIESDAYTFRNEDVRTVFTLSRELLRGNIRQLIQKYQSQDIEIEAELLSVIGKIVGSSYIEKNTFRKEKKKMKLCTSLQNFYDEGIRQGIRQGISQGISQGITQGIMASAGKLLSKGYSATEVADLLDLTAEEFSQLTSSKKESHIRSYT